MENKCDRFKNACSVMTQELMSVLIKAPQSITASAQQISLRVNRPLCIECLDDRYFFTKSGCVVDKISDQPMVTCSPKTLFNVFQNICNYSVYSRQYEINNGYITLRGGHRAGICGTAVMSNGQITNIKDITTINIRISREIKGCADKLMSAVEPKNGVLVCGAPCSGKTTLLRDFARSLSQTHRVCLIDERNELSSNVNGVFYNDIGMCDVFDSYEKSTAITQAIRSMSPDIIVCDEVSAQSDVSAIQSGVNSGVAFISTIHCDSITALRNRKIATELLRLNAFSQVVFLDNSKNPGNIKAIVPAKTILSGV